jgi:hypothetical protein
LSGVQRLGCSSAPLSPKEAESVLDLSTATKKRKVENFSTSDSFTVRKLMRTEAECQGGRVTPEQTVTSPLTVCTDKNNNTKNCRNRPLPVDQGEPPVNKVIKDINGNHIAPLGDVLVESTTDLVDVSSWDTDQVVRFVSKVPGCQEYAEDFREHRIDGATLPHLSEDHLLNQIKMKLGPAIRLRLAITKLHSTCKD